MQGCETIAAVVQDFDCDEILLLNRNAKKNDLWKPSQSGRGGEQNSVWPRKKIPLFRAELPKLLEVKTIGNKYGFRSVCYGHAGDGNLSVNIIRGDLTEKQWNENAAGRHPNDFWTGSGPPGGTLAVNTALDCIKTIYMNIAPLIPIRQQELFCSIKKIFEIQICLNPGKFPDIWSGSAKQPKARKSWTSFLWIFLPTAENGWYLSPVYKTSHRSLRFISTPPFPADARISSPLKAQYEQVCSNRTVYPILKCK